MPLRRSRPLRPSASRIISGAGFSSHTMQQPPHRRAEDTDSVPVTTDSWKLVLVNPWNSLAEGYSVETVTLGNGLKVDKRCCPDLQAMMDACRADGLSPVICSAYRTRENQEQLYQRKVEQKCLPPSELGGRLNLNNSVWESVPVSAITG